MRQSIGVYVGSNPVPADKMVPPVYDLIMLSLARSGPTICGLFRIYATPQLGMGRGVTTADPSLESYIRTPIPGPPYSCVAVSSLRKRTACGIRGQRQHNIRSRATLLMPCVRGNGFLLVFFGCFQGLPEGRSLRS